MWHEPDSIKAPIRRQRRTPFHYLVRTAEFFPLGMICAGVTQSHKIDQKITDLRLDFFPVSHGDPLNVSNMFDGPE
ncbi:hypothetical protein [Erythrobacter sp. JK5]|uniref:hypothetical protein n=1 Tax=Erythrobacter sp. JK5 TaxID=2829500 RepID=UPI001BA7856D|nr:hypothetical protein [Erythrobacter sp. JK5]QUL37620.1 hypothetical protein KDC96_14945 [Erythrobacter sp. JK5]